MCQWLVCSQLSVKKIEFKLSFVDCFIPRGLFCKWCIVVYFSLCFICLASSLFAPDFNTSKVLCIIVCRLLIAISMIFACLNLYSSHAFIYLSGISSQFPVVELLLNVIDLFSVL